MRQNFVRLSVQDDVPDRKTPVSKFLAAAAFIIVSAQSAVGKDHQIECDRYSSAASGQRTVLQFQQDPNRADFIRQGIQQYWHFGGSLGTSLEGTIYTLSDYPNSKGSSFTVFPSLLTTVLALRKKSLCSFSRTWLFGQIAHSKYNKPMLISIWSMHAF